MSYMFVMPYTPVQKTGKRKALEIVKQILENIKTGECKKGDRLPSEHRLAELTEVGRPVVREALSALHIVGVIKTKLGDGSYVQTGSSDKIQSKILSLFDYNKNPFETLQARKYLESGIVELATKAVTYEEISNLESLLEKAEISLSAVKEGNRNKIFRIYLNHDSRFHTQITAISGNSLLINQMNFFFQIMNQKMWPSIYRACYQEKVQVHSAIREHREIVKWMKAKDPNHARQATQQHFENVRGRVIKYAPHAI